MLSFPILTYAKGVSKELPHQRFREQTFSMPSRESLPEYILIIFKLFEVDQRDFNAPKTVFRIPKMPKKCNARPESDSNTLAEYCSTMNCQFLGKNDKKTSSNWQSLFKKYIIYYYSLPYTLFPFIALDDYSKYVNNKDV